MIDTNMYSYYWQYDILQNTGTDICLHNNSCLNAVNIDNKWIVWNNVFFLKCDARYSWLIFFGANRSAWPIYIFFLLVLVLNIYIVRCMHVSYCFLYIMGFKHLTLEFTDSSEGFCMLEVWWYVVGFDEGLMFEHFCVSRDTIF